MGTNALHLAAYLNRYDIVADFSSKIDTVDVKDDYELTSLFMAWINDSKESFDLLLKKGANFNEATPWEFTNRFVDWCGKCSGNQIRIERYITIRSSFAR